MKKLAYLFLAILLVACGPSTFQTQRGTVVTYATKGKGELPTDSMISMMNIRYATWDDKEMMKSEEPMPIKIDHTSPIPQGELFEVIKMLKIGDSVTFELQAEELFKNTFRAPLPDSIPGDSTIKFEICLVEQVTEARYFELAAEKAAKAAEKQLAIDLDIIDTYLVENDIEAMTTESGLRYVITEEGSGPKPNAGQMVRVGYTGWILNGEHFDSSDEAIAKEHGIFNPQRPAYEPYKFAIGQGAVIKGWDEGIALLNEGSKARIWVPSPLGYGSSNRSRIIKPNSILVFDVELVEVE